jgi:urease accessory protein UreH
LNPVDSRVRTAVGRQARLALAFERREGRTVLRHAYAEPPFRVAPCFAIGDAAYYIVTCAAPGVFGGDSLHVDVCVGRGARVVLTSQAALQVHPAAALKGPPYDGDSRSAGLARSRAVINQHYTVEDDAELHCHWDPTIPFAKSVLAQQVAIELHGSSRMYWSDALLAGRVDRGEAWQFRELAHELTVRIGESLAYLERYRLVPDVDGAPRSRWRDGGGTQFGTTFVHHPEISKESVERVHCTFVRAAAAVAEDLVEPRVMVARIMGAGGAAFAAARQDLRRLTLGTIFHTPELAGRK